MPKKDWKAILDSVRAKTGKTNLLVSSDVAVEVQSISGEVPVAVEFSQMNPIVTRYMEEIDYDPADYSTSNVMTYSYTETDYTKSHPVGREVTVNVAGKVTLADRFTSYTKESFAGTNEIVNAVPNSVVGWWNASNGSITASGYIKPTGQVRMIKTFASNVRDLGGWPCDGGTIRYGKLFRGGALSVDDATVLVEQCGVRHDLDLRGTEAGGITESPLGSSIYYTCPGYPWYTLNSESWKFILRTIFDAVAHNEPLIFHCSAGADRTGTVACVVEALLGVSQPDIDKDFELTTFAVHPNARRRTDENWRGLIGEINAIQAGETMQERIAFWVNSLGFTWTEINGFRQSMIDGNPSYIEVEKPSYSRLPAEYQEVEWVQIVNKESADTTSCVRTNTKWSQATKIITKVQNVNTTNPKDMFFAAWVSGTAKSAPFIATSDGPIMGSPSGLTGYGCVPSNIANNDGNANEFTLTFTATAATDITFGSWYDATYSHPHRWYKVEIYSGDTMLANFVPCYRKSDGVNGFYDLVSGEFHVNANTVSVFDCRGSDVVYYEPVVPDEPDVPDTPDTPALKNFADPTSEEWLVGKRLGTSSVSDETNGSIVTNCIPVVKGDVVTIEGMNICWLKSSTTARVHYLDENKNVIGNSNGWASPTVYSGLNGAFKYEGGASYQSSYKWEHKVGTTGDGTSYAEYADQIAYIRFCGSLETTAENVLINVNGILAEEEEPDNPGTSTYTNLADPTNTDWLTNKRLGSSGVSDETNGSIVTNYIPCKTGDVVRVSGLNIGWLKSSANARCHFLASDKSILGTSTVLADDLFEFTDNTNQQKAYAWIGTIGNGDSASYPTIAYIRFCGSLKTTAADVIITVNEEIV